MFCLGSGVTYLAITTPSRSSLMKIGVPKEIKIHEYRVGLVPAGVRELVDAGHEVLVEAGAGGGIGFDNSHYLSAGARIAATPEDVFASSELIIKVKEPQLAECRNSARARFCSRICTWLQIVSRLRH
jgi:alanine dehydrogenase